MLHVCNVMGLRNPKSACNVMSVYDAERVGSVTM